MGHEDEQQQTKALGRSTPGPLQKPLTNGPVRPLTRIGGGAPADGEDLPQVLVLLGKALLQPLQLAQALAALVLHGAHVLDEVQLGLGGVVAQDAVVIATFALHSALVLLQVLRGAEERDTSWVSHWKPPPPRAHPFLAAAQGGDSWEGLFCLPQRTFFSSSARASSQQTPLPNSPERPFPGGFPRGC